MKKSVNSVNTKKEVKKVLDLKTLTDEQLLNTNLDEVNILELLENNESLKPKLNSSNGSKESMFKYSDEIKGNKVKEKNFRTKARKKRNSFIENLISAYQASNLSHQKQVLKDFNTFYKETYLKNDYSIQSISRLNADKNTLSKIKVFFHIISKMK